SLSLVMILFTSFLSLISILCSWYKSLENPGFFYFNILWITSSTMGIFLAIDLFLFFFFWECVLIPIYFILLLWGLKNKKFIHECKTVANTFFIYSQISGLILLLSILGLVCYCYYLTNVWTFNYNILINIPLSLSMEYLLLSGFFLAFIIKMPIVPLHCWLPNVHVQLPTSGSVDLSGFLLKTSVYGLLRFCIPLFPNAFVVFSKIGLVLGVITIVYASLIACVENNIKRLISYASISHMGILLIGICVNSALSLKGVIIQMVSNGISTAGLFILTGYLYERLKTYDIRKMDGLSGVISWIPGLLLFFSVANVGIPGTGNFVGEFLILLAAFQKFPIVVLLSYIGLIIVVFYSLNLIQRLYYGKFVSQITFVKINMLEFIIIFLLIFVLVVIGCYPNVILDFFCG
ncbi:NADH-quinone oxidoreductase subunit M, partial [Buchnera aphidicola (Hormaphis cornu)]